MSEVDQRDVVPCDKQRILIVDDEKTIREVFTQVISYGLPECRIDVAINGAEAVESFRTIHHGLLLMDLKMPIMDGETAFHKIEEICKAENWEMPPVIFCTGYAPSEELRKIIANSQLHSLLHKPVTNDVLLQAISHHLQVGP